jgi:cytoskeleton protein RodZ
LSVTVAFVIFAILGIVFLPDEWFGKNWPTSKLLESHPALAGKSDNTQPADTSIPFASSPAYVQPLDSVDLSANISPPMPKASSDTTAVVNQKPLIPIANTPSGNNALVLSAIGDSWVEVRDAQGIVQLSRILNKGETIHVSGTLPLFVVLGRAELVTVLVRGQPFDTAGLTKENVARFEVK